MRRYVVIMAFMTAACGSLEKKAALINPGDTKQSVMKVMGAPADRQFRETQEAWQYCKSSVGYFDYRVVWFDDGLVTGITSYRERPHMGQLSCKEDLKSVRWEDAPDQRIEIRKR